LPIISHDGLIEQFSSGKVKMYEQPDHYTIKAKKMGYPARSVFKLMDIDKKFQVLGSGERVLDIGAAPGSWSLYVLSRLGETGRLCACDLSPLADDKRFLDSRFTFLQGDAFVEPVLGRILSDSPFDLILSDAAPSTTGNRTVDTARSENLIDSMIFHVLPCLTQGGTFIAKIFQGGAEKKFLLGLRPRFETCSLFKPESCRKSSFETFLVCRGFKD
jgi:23S rRNA (uridine2552-2'-O)-methyltransferase